MAVQTGVHLIVQCFLSLVEPCDVEYKEIGCYKDNYWRPPRPIPDMLSTEADKYHSLNNGHQILWYKWNKYFPQMICRCAKETFQRKWDTFGVQNYGKYMRIGNGQT